ncbi:FAST kinase domain-containing protein 5, mitochondrial-like [Babylonia areolata]|uniref:FAST kinase domain-containing protein 5, mitochondrial-like n=1 Tax=Babylonia areolata TaxID=304850 RepID=UPI003FD42DF3
MVLYHSVINMKTCLPNALTRGLLLTHTLFSKCTAQFLPKRIERLKWLHSMHVPASFHTSKKCSRILSNVLQRKHGNGPLFVDGISFQKRCSSTLATSSTAKWDSKTQAFVENENEYFHSYLESVSVYQPYFLSFLSEQESGILPYETVQSLLQEIKEKKTTEKLLLLLGHWSGIARTEGCSVLSDKSLCQTVKLLQRNIKLLSVEEMMQSITYLNNLGFRQNTLMTEPRRNRIILSKAFDQAFTQHIKQMNVKDLLLAADFFYSVRGSSFAEYTFAMCERMKLFLPTMTKPELILLFFHMSMTRRTPPNMVQTMMDHLRQHLNSLTLQELGIVNLAHYKTQSLVRCPEYFLALTARLNTDVGQGVNPICLSSVLKYQHRSLNRCKDQLLPQFFTTLQDIEDPLLQQVPKASSESVMRVISLYYSLNLLSEDLFTAVIDRITHRGVQDWRLKDVAKVTHILTNIPLGSESKAEALEVILLDLQRKERQPEMDDHPRCLLQMAVSLTFCGMYPHWLVGAVLGPSAEKYFRGSKIDYRQDLYHLSQSVSIEDKSYEGPLLQAVSFPRLSKNKVYRKLTELREGDKAARGSVRSVGGDPTSGDDLFHRDRILLDVMDALCQVRPRASPVPTFLLPHFHTADVELVHKQAADLEVDDKKYVREVAVLHASNAYQTVRCRDGHAVPLLRQYHAMRARQLRALGTHVIEVPHFEFETNSDRRRYLLTKFQQEEDRQQSKAKGHL